MNLGSKAVLRNNCSANCCKILISEWNQSEIFCKVAGHEFAALQKNSLLRGYLPGILQKIENTFSVGVWAIVSDLLKQKQIILNENFGSGGCFRA